MHQSDKAANVTQAKALDFAQLLGFGNLADRINESVDFQDETVAARLGAKVGDPKG